MRTPSSSRSNSCTLYSKCICGASRACGVSAVGRWLCERPENTASTVLPDAPPGLSRPTFSLSRPGVTRTGSLNVTVNRIVSYERYVSPDCGADATTTEVTLGSGGDTNFTGRPLGARTKA